jgi:hypothetical protein
MNTTSAGRFFKLSAMRTRKLASDRQKEKNFMRGTPLLPFSHKGRREGRDYPAPVAFLKGDLRAVAEIARNEKRLHNLGAYG